MEKALLSYLGDVNLLASPVPEEGQETFTTILETDKVKLERIHSNKARSPEGFWYD